MDKAESLEASEWNREIAETVEQNRTIFVIVVGRQRVSSGRGTYVSKNNSKVSLCVPHRAAWPCDSGVHATFSKFEPVAAAGGQPARLRGDRGFHRRHGWPRR